MFRFSSLFTKRIIIVKSFSTSKTIKTVVVNNKSIETVKQTILDNIHLPFCIDLSSDLVDDSFNNFCNWCLENNDLHIQRLLLFDHKITNSNLKDLVTVIKSPQCSGLIDLNLTDTNLTTSKLQELLGAMQDNQIHLKYFECDSNSTLKGDLGNLLPFKDLLSELSEWCLDSNFISDTNIPSLLDLISSNSLSQLTSLNIRDNQIHDHSASSLLPLLHQYTPQLRCLGLSLNPLTDQFVKELIQFFQNDCLPSLEELQVQFPKVKNPTLMNDLMNCFCKGLSPLDSTFASMGIYYRNKSDEESDEDLSDLIDIEESEIE